MQKFKIKVISSAKKSLVLKIDQESHNEYKIYTKAMAINGRANESILDLLSQYFNVPKKRIKIIHGFNTSSKLIQILD